MKSEEISRDNIALKKSRTHSNIFSSGNPSSMDPANRQSGLNKRLLGEDENRD
jgi:hypothetical protein